MREEDENEKLEVISKNGERHGLPKAQVTLLKCSTAQISCIAPFSRSAEYRVKAINSSGQSMPSNTISVVL